MFKPRQCLSIEFAFLFICTAQVQQTGHIRLPIFSPVVVFPSTNPSINKHKGDHTPQLIYE